MFHQRNHVCAGAIINRRLVLTAGHCICDGNAAEGTIDCDKGRDEKVVVLGDHDIRDDENEDVKEIHSVLLNPSYVGMFTI